MKLRYNHELARAIKDAGMTQNEVADKSDISPPVLSQMVRGRLNPTADEMTRIAKALGVSESELFGAA